MATYYKSQPYSTLNTNIYGAPWAGPYTTLIPDSGTVAEMRSKDSVDDGVFTPNIYRVNPYSVHRTSYKLESVDLDSGKLASGSWWYQMKFSGPAGAKGLVQAVANCPPLSSSDTWRARVLQDAAAKIGKNEIGGGENLGELRETINLFRHPFKDLGEFLSKDSYHYLKQYKKLRIYANTGNWVGKVTLKGASAAKAASNAWLEYRYGVQPLMYTVFDLVKMAEKQASVFLPDQIKTSRSKLDITERSSMTVPTWVYSGGWAFSGEFVREDKFTIRAQVQYRMDAPLTSFEKFGLHPRFMPELAYELTRLSFALDWWFSVGDWLGQLRVITNPHVTILGNTIGVKAVRNVAGKGTGTWTSPSGVRVDRKVDFGSYDDESYTRFCGEHLPYSPQLQLEFKSVNHAIDAAALILQAILHKMR